MKTIQQHEQIHDTLTAEERRVVERIEQRAADKREKTPERRKRSVTLGLIY